MNIMLNSSHQQRQIMTPESLHKLRVQYDIAKSVKRNLNTGKPYTDRDFANDYLDSNYSMVTKVLTGKAVSKPTTDAIIKFIKDTHPELKSTVKYIEDLVKNG